MKSHGIDLVTWYISDLVPTKWFLYDVCKKSAILFGSQCVYNTSTRSNIWVVSYLTYSIYIHIYLNIFSYMLKKMYLRKHRIACLSQFLSLFPTGKVFSILCFAKRQPIIIMAWQIVWIRYCQHIGYHPATHICPECAQCIQGIMHTLASLLQYCERLGIKQLCPNLASLPLSNLVVASVSINQPWRL